MDSSGTERRAEAALTDQLIRLAFGIPGQTESEAARRRRQKRMLKGKPAVAQLARRLDRYTPEGRCDAATRDACRRPNPLRLVIGYIEQRSGGGE